MPVEEQVAVIFAGNQGFLDDLEVARVRPFMEGLRDYLRSQAADVLADIRDKGQLSEETEARLKEAVAAYHNSFAADAGITPELAGIEAETEVEATEAEA
jgi:F-type H+-transporting ATPase subunit alpha